MGRWACEWICDHSLTPPPNRNRALYRLVGRCCKSIESENPDQLCRLLGMPHRCASSHLQAANQDCIAIVQWILGRFDNFFGKHSYPRLERRTYQAKNCNRSNVPAIHVRFYKRVGKNSMLRNELSSVLLQLAIVQQIDVKTHMPS